MSQMPSNNNDVIMAAAGSGKTTSLVKLALDNPERKILITTYTLYNLEQIRKSFIREKGCIPPNVTVQTWFSFLLQDCARPYQNYYYDKKRIQGIFFVPGVSARYKNKSNVSQYYFAQGDRIYTDKISEFATFCDEKSGGKVVNRLSAIYDVIYIDEVQDLAGYDLEFLKLLFQSKIKTILVGDCRQATYSTNHSRKNNKYKGYNILSFFQELHAKSICNLRGRPFSYRCKQPICDFADQLYPEMENTESKNIVSTNHDGIFAISKGEVQEYITKYTPQVLRFSRKVETMGHEGMNFGVSKGLSFNRVLIFPTKNIENFLRTHNVDILAPKTKANLYVAVTRARQSVVFVCKQPNKAKGCQRLTESKIPTLFD